MVRAVIDLHRRRGTRHFAGLLATCARRLDEWKKNPSQIRRTQKPPADRLRRKAAARGRALPGFAKRKLAARPLPGSFRSSPGSLPRGRRRIGIGAKKKFEESALGPTRDGRQQESREHKRRLQARSARVVSAAFSPFPFPYCQPRWRPRQDSNLRPTASKAVALSS